MVEVPSYLTGWLKIQIVSYPHVAWSTRVSDTIPFFGLLQGSLDV